MTRHAGLPTPDDVQAALAAMARDGNQVSVLALAQRLGLANTTFRRNFPTWSHSLPSRHQRQPRLPLEPDPAEPATSRTLTPYCERRTTTSATN
jgi:hypothetical protein